MAERCELTELLVGQCGCPKHRGGRTPQEEANAEALHDPSGRWIEARYAGHCAECGEPFHVGTRIRASHSPMPHWIAECCAEQDERANIVHRSDCACGECEANW